MQLGPALTESGPVVMCNFKLVNVLRCHVYFSNIKLRYVCTLK